MTTLNTAKQEPASSGAPKTRRPWYHVVGLAAMGLMICAAMIVPLFSALTGLAGDSATGSAEIDELLAMMATIRDYVFIPGFIALGWTAIIGGIITKRRSKNPSYSFGEAWTAAPIMAGSAAALFFYFL
jgi:hypothetical protein